MAFTLIARGSEPAINPYPTISATPSYTCPTCYFGATSATLHSFPYIIVATITEEVTPIVTFDASGNACTSFKTSIIWPTVTDPHLQGGPTFKDICEMTWSTEGYHMQYPHTYVQYLGLEKDSVAPEPVTSAYSSLCLGDTSSTAIELPTRIPSSRYIYPLTAAPWTVTSDNTLYFSVPVATQFLDYLEVLGNDSNCTDLTGVKQCAALTTSYANYDGPIDAPTVTLCDTTYATITTLATTTSDSCTCEPPSYDSISTIINCSFKKRQGDSTTLGIGIRGKLENKPYTTWDNRTLSPFTPSSPKTSTRVGNSTRADK